MKKIITFIISICIMLSFSFTVYADDMATVYADTVDFSSTDQVLVPVKISGNKGIMGFKITVEYPEELIVIDSVTKGEITSVGNFNTNIGVQEGMFDIVWNNTNDVRDDGTLFVLSLKAKTEIKENTQIMLSFSQPDTFNEAWQDVKLDCKNIKISASKNVAVESTKEDSIKPSTTLASSQTDTSQIKDAVDITLQQNNAENLSDIKDKDKFVKDLNNNLEIITGTDKNNVNTFKEAEKIYTNAYKKEFLKEVIDNVNADKITSIVNETLKEYGAKSISDLNDEDKEKFVKSVDKKIKAEDPDVPSISKDLRTDDALKTIDKIYKQAKSESKNKSSKYVFFLIIPIALVVVIVLIVIKRKKQAK